MGLVAVLWIGWGAAAAAESPLGARLDPALETRALRRARVGVLVVRASDGRELYAREPDRRLVPASNLKVLTALAALEAFGPTHRFSTWIYADRPPDAQGRVGTLVVRGGGDPAVNSEDWWQLANQLRGLGLRGVEGDLLVDDSAFDRDRWHPTWGRISARAYHAPVSAITANYGSFAVRVLPGAAPGDPVSVDVDPPIAYLRVSNRARTVAERGRRLRVDRVLVPGGEEVQVRGTLRAGARPRTFYRSVLDPTRYAGAVLRHQLQAVGIEVQGAVGTGRVPANFEPLYAHRGRPLSDVVSLFMKHSNNVIGETLVKNLGARSGVAQGSWSSGLAEMTRLLTRVGLKTGKSSWVDGSGLSTSNRLTARVLVDAVRVGGASFRYGPEFRAAFPIAARDGTLERRVDEAPERARAKTGLLNDSRVTALTGWARVPEGYEVVFSILVNGYRVSGGEAMDAVDAFVAALVGGTQTFAGP
ncbi:MAG: D-alanyl-D-alanine carboxypeptidase/D-alanyl-D-alanine-endopeptidase [Proteobacteria bacterium]|nr:D-alanyl-D-alanine carboxypeptidase/D-alanyl-D-alanine-endopeptidase [Pseudomonadota bacterium]